VPAAQDALTKMGVPARTMADLLNDWQVTLDNEISNITASQIATAVYYQVETPDQGYADLKLLGYSPYDAWRILSIRLHTPVKLTGGNPPRPPEQGLCDGSDSANLTNEAYKAKLRKVVEEGRARLDKARQAPKLI